MGKLEKQLDEMRQVLWIVASQCFQEEEMNHHDALKRPLVKVDVSGQGDDGAEEDSTGSPQWPT